MFTITDMSSLVIKAQVNEKYFEAIKEGNKLPVILNAYPNDTLSGKISLVYPQVDPVTRSVKFDIKILNFNKKLLPGMMASIKIPVSEKENAISIPNRAILTSPENENFIFVVDSNNVAHRRVVEKGMDSNNQVEIINGLKEGEKVVVDGQGRLKDSMQVKTMK
ncbi:MAG: efflux RND transporter periplasmic adaptor subunit [Bacteroidales bacterium]|nr:efflux RND transporter periplasmic adaptor subunit [Bacteroidales bacterium]